MLQEAIEEIRTGTVKLEAKRELVKFKTRMVTSQMLMKIEAIEV